MHTRTAGLAALLPVFVVGANGWATEPAHDLPKTSMPKEFEALKRLVGQWEGKTKMGTRKLR